MAVPGRADMPNSRPTTPPPEPPSEPLELALTGSGAPGALTRLLEELARTPTPAVAESWQRRLAPGEVIGRFELLSEAGRGGFGVVYEARDLELGRLVAFKAFRPGRVIDQAQAENLRREAEAAAQLNHPNVVTVHDFGTCDAGPYLIMELLRGEPLSHRLDPGPLPPREAVSIAAEVARALVHAHGAGVIHRDLKPANVFLCRDGQVKVLDFGLAGLLGAAGARGGTPGYMAPEQRRGADEDERTDLFALGVVLHRMLTAGLPFAADEALDGGPSPAPRGPGIPPRLSQLVHRLLAKDPAARPSSAAAALDELVAIAGTLDPAQAARRRRRIAGVALALVLAAGAGILAGLWSRVHQGAALQRVTVAVADFSNETGEPDLEGLSAMLITSLEQSSRLAVLTRSRMRDEVRQMGRGDPPRIDEGVARDVGRRVGVKALLLGSIRRSADAYAVELRALDPRTEERLFTLSERTGGKREIPELLDRMSARARRELREGSDEVGGSRIRVSQAFTADLEAYRHYFLGVDCIDRRSANGLLGAACGDHFRRALAVDPGFAMAHYQLAYLGAIEETVTAEARRDIDAAAVRLEGAPMKERHLILAWKAHLEGRDGEALAHYRQVLERFPDDKDALFLTGSLLHLQGDHERAIPFMEKALALDPTFDWALDYLTTELVATGRLEELRQYAGRWESLPPSPATLHALTLARFGLGDEQGALAAARRHAALPTATRAARDVARVLFSSGDYRGAERELRAAVAAGSRDDMVPLRLVYALHAQGRAREALEELDRIEWLGPGRDRASYHYVRAVLEASRGAREDAWAEARAMAEIDPEVAAGLASDLALHGDFERAQALAARLPAPSSRQEVWQAIVAWKSGDLAGAKSRLRALDRLDPTPLRAPMPSFLLAEIAAGSGEDAEVVSAVRRYRGFCAQGLRDAWTSPRATLRLARSQLRLGQTGEARDTLDRLLAQWSSADRDHPLLQEARALDAELARLGVRGSPR